MQLEVKNVNIYYIEIRRLMRIYTNSSYELNIWYTSSFRSWMIYSAFRMRFEEFYGYIANKYTI